MLLLGRLWLRRLLLLLPLLLLLQHIPLLLLLLSEHLLLLLLSVHHLCLHDVLTQLVVRDISHLGVRCLILLSEHLQFLVRNSDGTYVLGLLWYPLCLSWCHRCGRCHARNVIWLRSSPRHLLLSLQHILEVNDLKHEQLLSFLWRENCRILLSPLLKLSPALDIRR